MRYPACEKLEIIRLVEQSHLPVRRTLDKIGIPRPTFYRWYDLYRCGGPGALEDGRPGPDRAWNRIPGEVQRKLVDLALVGQRKRGLPQPCADPFRAGIDAVRSCCHTSSLGHFIDN